MFASVSTVIFQASDAVKLDLLTYAELELLKAQKSGTGTHMLQGSRSVSSASSTKKYLIITYAVEFDK